ncbi:hypothetical protein BKA83DRAFT_4213911 [Pisolithus microcarpus]|nr:hypothetical protein BKA83DRAFT_4213911 [Pisolithus microcarpus]
MQPTHDSVLSTHRARGETGQLSSNWYKADNLRGAMSMQKANFLWRFLRRIFGMNPSLPDPPTIYNLFTTLDAYRPEVQRTFRWEISMTKNDFPGSSRCFVQKVTYHKSRSLDRHEFLLVIVGRTVDVPSLAKSSSIALTSCGCYTSPESLTQPAIDEITAATMGTPIGDELMRDHNYDLVSSLTFLNRAPSADEPIYSACISSPAFPVLLVCKNRIQGPHKLFEGSEDPRDGHRDGGKIHGSTLSLRDGRSCGLLFLRYNNATSIVHPGPQTTLEQSEVSCGALSENELQLQLALEASERAREQLLLEVQDLRSRLAIMPQNIRGESQIDVRHCTVGCPIV